MTMHTLIEWSLIAAALSLSICALFVARHTSVRSQSRRLAELSTRVEALESDTDTIRDELLKQLERERARANMAAVRARRKATERDEPAAESSNGSDGRAQTEAEKDEWQRAMNRKLLLGEVKLPGRR